MRKKQEGFTLIELLVVVAIIGILAAIAIPQFASYRQRAYDASARSDLRNAATSEEAYFVDNDTYMTCADAACNESAGGLPGFSRNPLVNISMVGAATSFTGSASHSSSTTAAFTWNSAAGGLQ